MVCTWQKKNKNENEEEQHSYNLKSMFSSDIAHYTDDEKAMHELRKKNTQVAQHSNNAHGQKEQNIN